VALTNDGDTRAAPLLHLRYAPFQVRVRFMVHFLDGENVMLDENMSRARRHFFHLVGALTGATILAVASKPAKAARSTGPCAVVACPRCMLKGTRILTPHGARRVEDLALAIPS